MKKTILLLIGATFLFVGYKNLPAGKDGLPNPLSNGAPAASTGAPDEMHCSNTGCHSDFAANSGIAELSTSIEGGITHYELGKTYPITVSITNPDLVRFGFQVVALKNSDNANVGTVKVVDAQRTQIIPGYGQMIDRRYITYTYDGTSAVSTGLGKWSFEWTAPETNEGAVTFYVAAVAANNDGTDSGDNTYSKRIALDAPAISWSVYPNVSSGVFTVSGLQSPVTAVIFNASGKLVYEVPLSSKEENVVLLPSGLGQGVYFISAVQNGKTEVQKIIISK